MTEDSMHRTLNAALVRTAAAAWTCEAHQMTTTGDCPRCDDELIALTDEAEQGDDLAAQIAHTLTCDRCRMGWSCGGLSEDDYTAGARIADLLAAHTAAALLPVVTQAQAAERERVAQAIEARGQVCSDAHGMGCIGGIAYRDAAHIARADESGAR